MQNQLLCATSLISVGTQLIAAIVIISLTFSMTNKTKELATESLTSQIQENTEITADQMSSVVNQRFMIISESILEAVDRSVNFMDNFDYESHIQVEAPVFQDLQNFPETDAYGTPFTNDECSTYMVSSPNNPTLASEYVREGSTWADVTPDTSGTITETTKLYQQQCRFLKNACNSIDAVTLAYIGTDFSDYYNDNTYNKKYKTFLNFPGNDYRGVTITNYDKTIDNMPYDPSERGWFRGAVENKVSMTEPYQDADTNQWMCTFTLKLKTSDFDYSSFSTEPKSVIAVDVLLTDLRSEISSIKFYSKGFAILLQYSDDTRSGDPWVLVYGDEALDSKKPLSEVDLTLYESTFSNIVKTDVKGNFMYSHEDGDRVGGFGTAFYGELVVVTVAPEEEALAAVADLKSVISDTEKVMTIIISIFVIFAILFSVYFVWYITSMVVQPLEDIQKNCDVIMNTQTKENKHFEISPITVYGHDRLFALSQEFIYMMLGMNDNETSKMEKPKYPENEFFNGNEDATKKQVWRCFPPTRYCQPEGYSNSTYGNSPTYQQKKI